MVEKRLFLIPNKDRKNYRNRSNRQKLTFRVTCIITGKDRAPSAAADMSDSNMSDYDYSYDEDDDEKADQTYAMMPEALVVRPRRVEDYNATQAPDATFDGGVVLKRCDRDIDDIDNDTASLADVGQRPTKSRRLDANAPTSSMWVRPVAAASDTAEKDGGDATADDHSDEVSDVTRSSVTLSWLAPTSDGGAAIVACVVERREHLSPTWKRVARVKPVSPDDSPTYPF